MKIKVLFVAVVLTLCGCSTMNETFSCNETAGDSCLTMDEVNAMTEDKGQFIRKQIIPHPNHLSSLNDSLWIAPLNDKGVAHA